MFRSLSATLRQGGLSEDATQHGCYVRPVALLFAFLAERLERLTSGVHEKTSYSQAQIPFKPGIPWKEGKPTVDTVGFLRYSNSNVFAYLIAAANSGIIIVSTKIPATIDAISFFVFLLYINPPLFRERL